MFFICDRSTHFRIRLSLLCILLICTLSKQRCLHSGLKDNQCIYKHKRCINVTSLTSLIGTQTMQWHTTNCINLTTCQLFQVLFC